MLLLSNRFPCRSRGFLNVWFNKPCFCALFCKNKKSTIICAIKHKNSFHIYFWLWRMCGKEEKEKITREKFAKTLILLQCALWQQRKLKGFFLCFIKVLWLLIRSSKYSFAANLSWLLQFVVPHVITTDSFVLQQNLLNHSYFHDKRILYN